MIVHILSIKKKKNKIVVDLMPHRKFINLKASVNKKM